MSTPVRYVFPSLGKFYDQFGNAAWPMVRICYGLFYIPHGYSKLLNTSDGTFAAVVRALESMGLTSGPVWASAIGALELIGGLLLVLGLGTRPIALLFALFNFFGAFFFYAQFGYSWVKGGMEVPLLMFLLAIALLLRGGGEFSLDRKLGREI
jgi:putative oxidoreductase